MRRVPNSAEIRRAETEFSKPSMTGLASTLAAAAAGSELINSSMERVDQAIDAGGAPTGNVVKAPKAKTPNSSVGVAERPPVNALRVECIDQVADRSAGSHPGARILP